MLNKKNRAKRPVFLIGKGAGIDNYTNWMLEFKYNLKGSNDHG